MRTYRVEIRCDDDLPDAQRARFLVCLARRFARLEDAGTPAEVEGPIDILDTFEGPFVWEMTPAQLEATPPVGVEFVVVSLTEVDADTVDAVVQLPT